MIKERKIMKDYKVSEEIKIEIINSYENIEKKIEKLNLR